MRDILSSHYVQAFINPMLGKPCCRKQVGFRKGLHIGLGAKVYQKNLRGRDVYYGEWEIGSYNSAWRIIQSGKILCGSHDAVDSIEELDARVNQVELGCISSIQQLTDLDIRVVFTLGIMIDFLAATSDDDDDSFDIFCPHNKYIEFVVRKGWTVGDSDKPWPNENTGGRP